MGSPFALLGWRTAAPGGRFSGRRKMYEQALAIWTATSDKIDIAETQLGLADLSLEEARSPVEQEAAVRQIIEVFRSRKPATTKPGLVRPLPRAACGRESGRSKRSIATRAHPRRKSQNPAIRWQTAIVAAVSKPLETTLPLRFRNHDAEGVDRHHRKIARARYQESNSTLVWHSLHSR